jgi:hypothetical protein
MPMCILEKEREHIGLMWSSVTYLALPLAAAQNLESRALEDSQRHRHLIIVTENKQL